MSSKILQTIKKELQKIIMAYELFVKQEMANHAAAGAYAFLLSALPVVLVLVYVSLIILGNSQAVISIISEIKGFDNLPVEQVVTAFFSKKLNQVAGAFLLLNLLWTSRLFVLSVQRGLRIIFSDISTGTPLRENLITFIVELLILVAVIAVISALQMFQYAVTIIPPGYISKSITMIISFARYLVPLFILWLFIVQTLRVLPAYKISTCKIIKASTVCTLLYTAIAYVIQLLFSTNRYGVIYGVLGNVIGLLIKVYFFFWLYFLFAEYLYTDEFFTSIAFKKYRALFEKKKLNKIDRVILNALQDSFKEQTIRLKPGMLLFKKDEISDYAYFIVSGSIGIYFKDPVIEVNEPFTIVSPGNFIGEMGVLLHESRSAWGKALDTTIVLVFTREDIEHLIIHSPAEARKMINLLSSRLRDLNLQFQEGSNELSHHL